MTNWILIVINNKYFYYTRIEVFQPYSSLETLKQSLVLFSIVLREFWIFYVSSFKFCYVLLKLSKTENICWCFAYGFSRLYKLLSSCFFNNYRNWKHTLLPTRWYKTNLLYALFKQRCQHIGLNQFYKTTGSVE